MLVYGDTVAQENLRAKRARVGLLLADSTAAARGIDRHAGLVAALIEAGELVQGWTDARFRSRGAVDDRKAIERRAMAVLVRLAGVVGRSWDDSFAPQDTAALVAELDGLPVPDETVEIRHPEGFAHYALYPEAYWAAARRLALPRPATVIGLRSIGTALAAVVAAALGAEEVETVRPVGHPFRRHLQLAPSLERSWTARTASIHAVVDEGPGLSGSSFGAVADVLERLGVPPENIAFFPGHLGDLGPEADRAHRARWQRTPRHSLGFEALTGGEAAPHQRLGAWIADLGGDARTPPVPLPAGGWRALLLPDTAAWPPVDAQNERLKFRAETARGPVLLRFTGLGRRGRARFDMAQALAAAGFCPAPLGWRHGFLVEPWLAGARPMGGDGPDRAAVLARLPAYLAFRADRFPAEPGSGASPAALHAMARANIAEGLGEAATAALDRFDPKTLAELAAVARPVRIDGRLHPWEWLGLPDGTVIKTDSLDHHAAHDLVGTQDIAWDIAGAKVEWTLSDDETMALAHAVECRTGRRIDPGLLALFAVAYPAFQLGSYTMAAGRADEPERPRLAARAGVYRTALLAAVPASSTWLSCAPPRQRF